MIGEAPASNGTASITGHRQLLTAFLFYLALAVALTWPLARDLDRAVADLGDPLLNTWIIDWVCHALTHDPLHLYDAPIFYPDRYPLAYSENLAGIALVVLPFHLAGASPIAVYNIAMLLGFALSGLGAFVLARVVTRHTFASLTAGVFYAFVSFRFDHLAHVQIVWGGWLPLMLAALIVYWRTPTTRHAAMLCAAFVMNGLTNIHWLLMGGFALAVTILALHWAEPRRDRRFLTRLGGALVIAALVLLPFLVPYRVVANLYRMKRFPSEVAGGSATLDSWLRATPRSWLYGIPDPAAVHTERRLFPGIVVLVLAAFGIVLECGDASRRSRSGSRAATGVAALQIVIAGICVAVAIAMAFMPGVHMGAAIPAMLGVIVGLWALRRRYPSFAPSPAAVWLTIGFVGSLGTNAFLHPFLFRVVEPFRAIRAPARWAMIAYVGLAIFAALGTIELTKRWKRIAPLILILAIVDVIPRIDWNYADPRVAPVYRWLARTRPRAAIELPMSGNGAQALYLLASTAHHVPIMNGASGWDGPTHMTLREKGERGEYDDEFLRTITQSGCEIVIVHGQHDEMTPLLNRLQFVRAFGSDRVFSIPRAPAGTASAPRESLPR
ncbi:MAG TPA: hypothetical protein VN181_14690 [Thermoanaerobaculia bacterium]|nr:hypothetical protein [Thermoanaerobaculia bacterium]